MMRDSNELELAVVRTLRDSLERLQRSSDELHHAVNDIVSACSSTRPANSLSPVIRAQTAAASLAASLDVLARFITIALHPGFQSPLDQREPAMTRTSAESAPYTSTAAPAAVKPPSGPGTAPQVESAPVISEAVMESQPVETVEDRRASDMVEEGAPVAAPVVPVPGGESSETAPVISEAVMESQPVETVEDRRVSDMVEEGAPVAPLAAPMPGSEGGAGSLTEPVISEAAMDSQPVQTMEQRRASDMMEEGAPLAPAGHPDLNADSALHTDAPESGFAGDAAAEAGVPLSPVEELPPPVKPFDIATLPPEEQELHRRANRVAKVSMQDIRMLRPADVKAGKEHRDLCHRLRDDIERAHKEYNRRFQAILGHPVDYFYDWMVETLADGDAGALGEYPYPSAVLRH